MKVAIKAYEDRYQGLHGMYSIDVIDVDSFDEAYQIARDYSIDVMERYGILDEIYDEAIELGIKEGSLTMEGYVEEEIDERAMYEIYKLKDDINKNNLLLSQMYYNNEKAFLKEYCPSL